MDGTGPGLSVTVVVHGQSLHTHKVEGVWVLVARDGIQRSVLHVVSLSLYHHLSEEQWMS